MNSSVRMNATQLGAVVSNVVPDATDDWRVEFLLKVASDRNAKRNLFSLLEGARELVEGWNSIPGICALLSHYVADHSTSQELDNIDLNAVIRLISYVSKLQEDFTCFNTQTDYTNIHNSNDEQLS